MASEEVLELPDTAVELVEYNGFEFDQYWFDYACNGLIVNVCNKFKYINVAYDGNNSGIFHLRDINGRWHTWSWKGFYREMLNRVDKINDEDIDYNQLCEFNEVALEPDKDKNVKDNCPYKAFRPKNLRTKEEDEWWKAKFKRDKEKRECFKVNDNVNENVDDEISVDECEAEN